MVQYAFCGFLANGTAVQVPANLDIRLEIIEASGRPAHIPNHPTDVDPPTGEVPGYTSGGSRILIPWFPAVIDAPLFNFSLALQMPPFAMPLASLDLAPLRMTGVLSGANVLDVGLGAITLVQLATVVDKGTLTLVAALYAFSLEPLALAAVVFGTVPIQFPLQGVELVVLPFTVDKGVSVRQLDLVAFTLALTNASSFLFFGKLKNGANVTIPANANGRLDIKRANGTVVEILNQPDALPLTGEVPGYTKAGVQITIPWQSEADAGVEHGDAPITLATAAVSLQLLPFTLNMGTKTIEMSLGSFTLAGMTSERTRVLSAVERNALALLTGQLNAYLALPNEVP
jgi:hypothetical protein